MNPSLDPTDSALVAVTLARIEGKLDRMGDKIADLIADRADHENRIRSLEKFMWKAVGAAAAVGGGAGALASMLTG